MRPPPYPPHISDLSWEGTGSWLTGAVQLSSPLHALGSNESYLLPRVLRRLL